MEFEDLAEHGLKPTLASRVWSVIDEANRRATANAAATSAPSEHTQIAYASQQPDYDPDKHANAGVTQYHEAASADGAADPAPAVVAREAYSYEHTMTVEEEERFENERYINQGGRRGPRRMQFL